MTDDTGLGTNREASGGKSVPAKADSEAPKGVAAPAGPPRIQADPGTVGANRAGGNVPARPVKKDDGLRRTTEPEGDQNIWRYSRRGFLEKMGWVGIFSFLGVMMVGTLRYMFPRVLFEPSPIFRAGFPESYLPNTVSTKWIRDYRVWIIRTEDRIYALLAVCTHLGCTPRWLEKEDKFKCPCHGSGFYRSGVNFEGPAPRSLERLRVTRDESGEIIVDKSIKFLYEGGGWEKSQSYLPV